MNALPPTSLKSQWATLHEQIEGNRKSIDDALETLERLVVTLEGKAWLARITEVRARYVASSARVVHLMEEGSSEEAVSLMNAETLPALNATHEAIRGLLAVQRLSAPARDANAKQQIDSALTMMTVLEGAPAAVWESPSPTDL